MMSASRDIINRETQNEQDLGFVEASFDRLD